MDDYEKLCKLAREVAKDLLASGKSPATYSGDGGSFQGWYVHTLEQYVYEDKSSYDQRWYPWLDSHGVTRSLMLDTDGNFRHFYKSFEVEQNHRKESTSIGDISPSTLVNLDKGGEPFSFVTGKLKRLKWA